MCGEVRPHSAFHEAPDHEGEDEDQSKRFDPFGRLQKQTVDELRILQECEVPFYHVLILVDDEEFLGIHGPGSFRQSVGDQHEASGFQAGSFHGVRIEFEGDVQAIFGRFEPSAPVVAGPPRVIHRSGLHAYRDFVKIRAADSVRCGLRVREAGIFDLFLLF